jgi:hypothetical protein
MSFDCSTENTCYDRCTSWERAAGICEERVLELHGTSFARHPHGQPSAAHETDGSFASRRRTTLEGCRNGRGEGRPAE